jgi:hypothetical protein
MVLDVVLFVMAHAFHVDHSEEALPTGDDLSTN